MKFLTPRLEAEWKDKRLALTTKLVLADAAARAAKLGWEFTITCIYRTPAEDMAVNGSGIHVDWRAVDIRTRDQKLDTVERVVAETNNAWQYDPARPLMVVAYAKPHGTGPHLHIQTCAKTQRRPS